MKPRAGVSPHPCGGSLGPSSARSHHRLFRPLPQINPTRQKNVPLPPIVDHEFTDASPPQTPSTSSHLTVPTRTPPAFLSPTCYMLQEEKPWEMHPPFAKIRPPPKVSRLDIGSNRLMRDCVFPQLPPLCTRGPPKAPFDPVEPSGETVGLGLLEEPVGLVAPTEAAAPFMSDPLRLDVSIQPDGGLEPLDVETQYQLPHSPSPLTTWTIDTSDPLPTRADDRQLGTPLHISPPSSSAASTSPSTSTRLLSEPFDSSPCLQSSLQAQSLVKPNSASPHPPPTLSSYSPRVRCVQVESPGRRAELLSKREARGLAKMANPVCKEPLGPLSNPELFASLSARAPVNSSRDRPGRSLGLALTLPPATALGQGRLSPIPANSFFQDEVIRQMSPVPRSAASYRVREG